MEKLESHVRERWMEGQYIVFFTGWLKPLSPAPVRELVRRRSTDHSC
jgi:hypothetical protein